MLVARIGPPVDVAAMTGGFSLTQRADGNEDDSPTTINTIIREAILQSRADLLLKTKVTVEGAVRVLDPNLGRMDVARGVVPS